MKAIKKFLLAGIGFIFLGLGMIGIFLPILPTTPFILMAIVCFSTSPRLKDWIMKLSFFREHMENYESRKGLSRKTIWISLGWLWGMLVLSMLLIRSGWIYLLLSLIGIAVTCHILWMGKNRQ